jgi:hypothetical protein
MFGTRLFKVEGAVSKEVSDYEKYRGIYAPDPSST